MQTECKLKEKANKTKQTEKWFRKTKWDRGFPGGTTVKNLPEMQKTLGQEDPQEREMATHSSILAWEIPWIDEPNGL